MMELEPGGSGINEVIGSDGIEVIDFSPDRFQDFCRHCRADWGDASASASANFHNVIKIRDS